MPQFLKFIFRFGSYSLQIAQAKRSDSGMYSCQINTVPIKELNVKLLVEKGNLVLSIISNYEH